MTRARDLANIIGPNGDLVVTGDLQVSGTTTTVNSTTVEIADKNILLGSGATANSQNTGAGLSVLLPDASPDEFATLVYTTSSDSWSFNKNVGIGTPDSDRLLNVVGTDTIVAEFENTSATGNARIYVTSGTATAILSQYGESHATRPNVTQLSGGSETRFINDGVTVATSHSTGTFAIGSGSSSNYVLTTNYDANATFSNAVSDFTQMWQNSGTNMLGVAGADDLSVRLVTNNGYSLAFNNGVTEAFRITTTGNIEAPSGTSGNFEIGIADNATDTFRTSATGLIIKGNDAFTGGSPQQASSGGDVEVRAGYGVDSTGLGAFAGDLTLSGGIPFSGNNSGAGQIFLKTNNTEVLTVSRDQKVGIGNTFPDAKLSVSTDGQVIARFASTLEDSSIVGIRMQGKDPSQSPVDTVFVDWFYDPENRKYGFGEGTTSGDLPINSGLSYADIVIDGGNVGIGSTDPAEPLTISYFDKDPAIQLERGDGTPATLRIDHNSIRTLTNTDLQIFTNGNNPQIFLDQSNGRVGVLSNQLAADGLTIGTAANGNCELDLTNTGATGTRWRFSSASSGHLVIQNKTDTIDAITILDNGNVGIGSSSTSHKLDVLGQGIRLQDTNSFGNISIGASQWNTTYPYLRVDSFPSDGSGYFWAFAHKKSDGTKTVRMLINDTNTPQVHIINELRVSEFTSNELGGTGNYPTFATNVKLRHSGDSYLNGGNVGIGTDSPDTKLEVLGDVSFSDVNGANKQTFAQIFDYNVTNNTAPLSATLSINSQHWSEYTCEIRIVGVNPYQGSGYGCKRYTLVGYNDGTSQFLVVEENPAQVGMTQSTWGTPTQTTSGISIPHTSSTQTNYRFAVFVTVYSRKVASPITITYS